MSSKEPHKDLSLPLPNGTSVMQPHSKGRLSRLMMALITFLAFMGALFLSFNRYPITPLAQVEVKSFYSTVRKHDNTDLCPGGVSYTGHIALKCPGRLSFYWFFQAQTEDWKTAPTILTFGGGPGLTGLSYPLRGESHCRITPAHITVRNSWAWTKRFNLLALDHPIGVGFSTGQGVVGGSNEAASDVYDFLQKFFTMEEFKDLAKNRFIISSGSYGGIYVPHIATMIQSGNRAIAQGHQSGIKIDLDSVMLNGPAFDGKTFYRHLLEPRCKRTDIFNPKQCDTFRSRRPECLKRIQDSLESGRSQDRKEAEVWCEDKIDPGTERRCLNKITLDPDSCNPQKTWIEAFFKNKKSDLGLGSQDFHYYRHEVRAAFREIGDGVQNTQSLYESLLQDGVRILTYVGKLDYNCHSLGIRHFLSLFSRIGRAGYKHSRHAGTGGWTIGQPGEKGEVTLIEVAHAGHLSISDQPDVIQDIIEHWIDKKEFLKYNRPQTELIPTISNITLSKK